MAMNEDSVVSSLNELRRMANDRARREAETRSRQEAERRGSRRGDIRPREARRSAANGGGFPGQIAPTVAYGAETAQQWQQPAVAASNAGYSQPAAAQSAWSQPDTYPTAHEPVRQKSAAGPVFLTILLLGGAAAGGYWKLQQDWQATLRARDAAILQAEDARTAAIKAEQQAKVQSSDCERKLKSASETPAAAPGTTAAASVVPGAPSAAPSAPTPAPVVAKKAAAAPVAPKPSKAELKRAAKAAKRAAAAKRASARAEHPARAAVAPEEKPEKRAAMPNILKKKKIDDDPLAGIRL